MSGFVIGIIGLSLAAVLSGIGSSIGLKHTVCASAGVIGEDPTKRGKLNILTFLPASQGLYGFIVAVIGLGYLAVDMDVTTGWAVLGACLPVAVSCLVSAVYQGKASAAIIMATGKKDEAAKSFIYPAMIEFYALLGFAASFVLLIQI